MRELQLGITFSIAQAGMVSRAARATCHFCLPASLAAAQACERRGADPHLMVPTPI